MKKLFFVLLAVILVSPNISLAENSIIAQTRGKILLQVEKNGEAWYVNPTDDKRYFLGRPEDAFVIMQHFGLGITNANLAPMPIGLIPQSGNDTDKDGLVDLLETAIKTNIFSKDSDNDGYDDRTEIQNWYNPNGPGKLPINATLTKNLAGRILLQVQTNGEAWYVNPDNNKRYYLGRPAQAFEIMRNLGQGITNADLDKIPIGNL
jgi:hypothetical protein